MEHLHRLKKSILLFSLRRFLFWFYSIVNISLNLVNQKNCKRGEFCSRSCNYWDQQKKKWSEKGCHVVKYGEDDIRCQCDRLGTFAAILFVSEIPVIHLKVLTFLTYFGGILNIIAMLSVLIYMIYKLVLTLNLINKLLFSENNYYFVDL